MPRKAEVWKFKLDALVEQRPLMTANARVLSAAMQDGDLMIWALVQPDATPVHRRIFVYGTGHPIPTADPGRFISTVLMEDGALVWHVFDGGEVNG